MTALAPAPSPPARAGRRPAPSAWRRVSANADLRRLGAWLLASLVLALMTGPSGSNLAPVSGFSGSWLHPRVAGYLGFGVAMWGLVTLRQRFGERLRAASASINRLPSRLLPDARARAAAYLVLLGAAIGVPQVLNAFWQEVLVDQIGIYVLLALGLNVVVGYAGLLDLGYIAFYAIGAYTGAYFTGHLPVHPPFVLDPFWIIPLAVAAAMLAGVLLGVPTLRLRGDYLAIVTLGFGEIIQIAANNSYGLTNGSFGVPNIPHFSFQILGIHYTWGETQLPYYYLLLGFVVVVIAAFKSLESSRVGRAWTAIREDEVAAQASGINVLKYKVMAFAIGASTSGFAGIITASKIAFIVPAQFTVQLSILVLVLVIFGGMGSIPGAIAGAAVLQWFPWYLRNHPFLGLQQTDIYIYFGALLIVMMIFRPQGVIPSRRRRREIGLAEHGIGSADAMSAGGAGGA